MWVGFPRGRVALVVLLTLVAAAVAAAGFFLTRDDDSPAAAAGSQGEGRDPATEAVLEGGPFAVDVEASIVMPEDLSDGVERRELLGSGTFDPASRKASIEYDLSQIPNGFGFLGSVKDVTVYYSEGSFVTTSDDLERVTGGNEWLGFRFMDFYTEPVAFSDTGQIRELGVMDPSLAVDLFAASDGSVADAEALEASSSETIRFLAAELEVDRVEVDATMDAEGVPSMLRYQLEYPVKPGDDSVVSITVTIDLRPTTTELLMEPSADEVIPYRELLTAS